MRAALLLFLLVGCDGVFQLDKVNAREIDAAIDGPPDSPIDAGLLCVADTSLLCADFDEAALQYFSGGLPYSISSPGGLVTVSRVDPGNTLQGMSIDSAGGEFALKASNTHTSITSVEVRAYLRFDRVDSFITQSALLVAGVNQNDGGFSSCYVVLELEPTGHRLIMQDYCGTNTSVDVLTSFPSGWVKFSLVLDIANATATTYVQNNQAGQVPLGSGLFFGAEPYAHVGLDGIVDAAVAFDEVIGIAQ